MSKIQYNTIDEVFTLATGRSTLYTKVRKALSKTNKLGKRKVARPQELIK